MDKNINVDDEIIEEDKKVRDFTIKLIDSIKRG